jgi:hypothetical protein
VRFACPSCGREVTINRDDLAWPAGAVPWTRVCACGDRMRRVSPRRVEDA